MTPLRNQLQVEERLENCPRCGVPYLLSVEGLEYDMLACPDCHATRVVPRPLESVVQPASRPFLYPKPLELAKPKYTMRKAVAWNDSDDDLEVQAKSLVNCARCYEPNPGWASHGLRCVRCQNELAAGEELNPPHLANRRLREAALILEDLDADQF